MARSVCTARFPLPINHSALGGLGERSVPGRNPQPRPRTRAPSGPTLAWDLPGEAMPWGRVLCPRSSRGAVPGAGASPPARTRAAEGHAGSSCVGPGVPQSPRAWGSFPPAPRDPGRDWGRLHPWPGGPLPCSVPLSLHPLCWSPAWLSQGQTTPCHPHPHPCPQTHPHPSRTAPPLPTALPSNKTGSGLTRGTWGQTFRANHCKTGNTS